MFSFKTKLAGVIQYLSTFFLSFGVNFNSFSTTFSGILLVEVSTTFCQTFFELSGVQTNISDIALALTHALYAQSIICCLTTSLF
jgi:hypothetical protein